MARDMAGPSFDDWIDQLGLHEVRDPHFDKPVYRKAPFGNLTLSADIEKEISASLRRGWQKGGCTYECEKQKAHEDKRNTSVR